MAIPLPNDDLVAKVGVPEEYDFSVCQTRLDRYGPYDPVDVAAAILMTGGVFSQMASLLGRNRNRVRDYVLSRPEVKRVYDEVRESILDEVECSVIKSALNGDTANQRFILTTLGKDRGYTTRVENTGANGGPVQVIDPSVLEGMSTEEIRSRLHTLNDLMEPKQEAAE